MKPKKNLISLVRVLVKPEYQGTVLYDICHADPYKIIRLSDHITTHNVEVFFTLKPDYFEDEYRENDWNEYPKFKPTKNGFYFVRFSNQAEYLRRWVDGDWYDLTGGTKSTSCKETTEFKFYKEEL